MRTLREAVVEIEGDVQFFSTFYAANGYFQIPLYSGSCDGGPSGLDRHAKCLTFSEKKLNFTRESM